MRTFLLLILFVSTIFYACKNDDTSTSGNPSLVTETEPNILFIIADDMGLDASPGYSLGAINPIMPNVQNMINSGVTFNNVWSNPVCTPTRAGILTGKYGFRTNVLKVDDELSTNETSIQKFINDQTGAVYSTAVIGKWHLSNNTTHPTNMGVDYYAGLLSGGVQSYINWNLTENGLTNNTAEYTTTKFTDLAINWVDNQTKPWFLWLAYNAPHTPFHLPPNDLHSSDGLPTDQASIDANPVPYYMAMLEALDTEIGRLLNAMTQEERDNTIVIFLGDNGTPGQVVQDYNSNRAKGSIHQGGVNVPMIVSGKNVDRINQSEDALINTTDLFATFAEISGTGVTSIHDSKSFFSLLSDENATKREYVYTELGLDTGGSNYTIRNTTHKYLLFENGTERFYDIRNNGLETTNLLNATQLPLSTENSLIKDELIAKLLEIRQ